MARRRVSVSVFNNLAVQTVLAVELRLQLLSDAQPSRVACSIAFSRSEERSSEQRWINNNIVNQRVQIKTNLNVLLNGLLATGTAY